MYCILIASAYNFVCNHTFICVSSYHIFRVQELKHFVHEVMSQIKDDLLPNLVEWGISVKDSLLSQPTLSHNSSALLLMWAVITEVAQKAPMEASE